MKDNQTFEIPDFDRAASTTRRLLEETKLSRLPAIPRRAVCGNCKGRLDTGDEYQANVKACRQSLKTFANVGDLIERYSAEKIRRTYAEAK